MDNKQTMIEPNITLHINNVDLAKLMAVSYVDMNKTYNSNNEYGIEGTFAVGELYESAQTLLSDCEELYITSTYDNKYVHINGLKSYTNQEDMFLSVNKLEPNKVYSFKAKELKTGNINV